MNARAAVSGQVAAGVIMAIVGALLAVVALFGLIFLPSASFPTTDAEILGISGLIVAVFGGAIAAID